MSQVRTEAYEEMSDCLKTFAARLSELATELEAAVKDCADNIDDDHTREVHSEVRGYTINYLNVAKAAIKLAQDLDDEKEAYVKAYVKRR